MTEAAPLCLGLHITKCAGTSLMTTLRRVMSEDEYYFFSSYHESWLASRPCFSDITAPDRLRMVFGHYCHETLLSVFAARPIFLFTGLREPIACAVSGFRQVNAVRAQAGREPVGAAAFLASHRNPICTEILRCFPSIAAGAAPVWQQARAALSLFDFIYATERFEDDAKTLFAVLDLPAVELVADNVSNARDWSRAYRDHLDAECLIVRRGARDVLGDDLLLWQAIQPYLSHPWVRGDMSREDWALDRAAFVKRLPDGAAARQIFRDLERDFMVHEFDELGRLGDLRGTLEKRIDTAREMLLRIRDYAP